MKTNNKIVALGVLLLMAGLVLVQMPATAQIGEIHTFVCVQFTKNGDNLGDKQCSGIANDLHANFLGRGEVQFTLNGRPVGDPQKSTPSANDFILKWDPFTGRILEFNWTRDGETIGSAELPPFANDLHFKTGKIVSADWTYDGRPIGEIPVPKGANDLEWVVERIG